MRRVRVQIRYLNHCGPQYSTRHRAAVEPPEGLRPPVGWV